MISNTRTAITIGVTGLFALVASVGTAGCGDAAARSGFDDGANAASPNPTTPDDGTLGDAGGGVIVDTPDAAPETTCAASSVQAKRAEVDFIVVIDTSGSMDEETAQVKQNINDFANQVGGSGLDYQVVVIANKPSTSLFFPIPGVCVPPPLGGANCSDNPPLFHQVNTTVGSTNSLSIILSSYDSSWKQFLRSTAMKVFIEITDDNSSLSYTSFDQQLLAKAPAGMFGDANKRKYIFDSICGWQDGTPVLASGACSTAVNSGDQYQHLSQLTGGNVESVCKQSFAGVFQNLAKGLITKLGCEFAMPAANGGQSVDPTKVAVDYTPGTTGATVQHLTQVTDASKCGTVSKAWYYDDPAKPQKIVFCPDLCSSAGTDSSGKLEILVGCKAPPPK